MGRRRAREAPGDPVELVDRCPDLLESQQRLVTLGRVRGDAGQRPVLAPIDLALDEPAQISGH